MQTTEMADHIAALAAELGITVEGHTTGGRAYQGSRKVKIRPVRSEITYAVALHEIGHIAIGNRSRAIGRLAEEAEAWEWARSNALEWTDRMSEKAEACVTSYVRSYNRRYQRGRAVRWPGPDHIVWTMTSHRPKVVR